MNELTANVLIVEDGDEYLESLTAFVRGPHYRQAHDAASALEVLRAEPIDLIYLDMRFDRIEAARLVGELDEVAEQHNGDRARALKHLQDHQGLYVLDHLERHGFGALPVILAYDFSREPRRFERLTRRYPRLSWVPDSVSADEIRARMRRVLAG